MTIRLITKIIRAIQTLATYFPKEIISVVNMLEKIVMLKIYKIIYELNMQKNTNVTFRDKRDMSV